MNAALSQCPNRENRARWRRPLRASQLIDWLGLRRFFLAAVLLPYAAIAIAVNYEMVDIGSPGNAADTTTFGAVSYPYRIGRYEVTVANYTEFLNAVAKTDTYGLWNNSMQAAASVAGITRSGAQGSYVYAPMTATSGTAAYSQSGTPPYRTVKGNDSSR